MKAVVRIDEKRDTTLTNKARSFELLFIWASTFLAVEAFWFDLFEGRNLL